ncbi:MAG: GNAT family N-acetyltransferase [Candidatus Competibacteraceae bacterium]|nr:GNAT family N-acetyltransferase [Candidatus Competibacteraceae bacterium]
MPKISVCNEYLKQANAFQYVFNCLKSSELTALTLRIKSISTEDLSCWNNFSNDHQLSCLYHSSTWRDVIQKSYGIDNYYLIASESYECQKAKIENSLDHTKNTGDNDNKIVGAFPLIYLNSWFFGNSLVSIPYFDSGGILAIDQFAEVELLRNCIKLAEELGVTNIDFRQNYRLLSLESLKIDTQDKWNLFLSTNKVRMVLNLPISSEFLIKSFKAKLRSQIHKPIKEGLIAKIGGIELIDDFYNVFAENMRDLGSPVHSRKFFAETLKAFPNTANVFIVYDNQKPLAGSVTIGYKDTLSNPWASSLRRYRRLAPNMLLYWSMLEFACQNGYCRFDFGRSTPNEGTYKFKEQWGAKPEPLYWYRFSKIGSHSHGCQPDKSKMTRAIECWKKLPVFFTKIIGPGIRKYISL